MNRRILVVDDESTVTELIRVLLTAEGFAVTTASNGSQGLQLLDSVDPDLVITDISMPDMEGVEFISLLRKRSANTPIIAMSGNTIGMNFLKATRLFGAAETILKPFSSHDLVAAVNRSLSLE